MRRFVGLLAVVGAGAVAGCGANVKMCHPEPSPKRPGGGCIAEFYKLNSRPGGSVEIRVEANCQVPTAPWASTFLSFRSRDQRIAVRWIEQDTIEVALPPDADIRVQRTADTLGKYRLTYVYRTLRDDERPANACWVPFDDTGYPVDEMED